MRKAKIKQLDYFYSDSQTWLSSLTATRALRVRLRITAGVTSVTSSPAGLVTVDINHFRLVTQDLVDTILGEARVQQLRAALVG